MWLRVLIVAPVLGSVGLLSAATVSAASLHVNPQTVPVGGTVTLSGDVLGPNGQPGCVVPGTVTLISGVFAGQGTFQHQDIETTAGADSKYRVQAKILPGVAPGTYTITGRCGGGNLGVQATLVVTPRLPLTGSGAGGGPMAGVSGGLLSEMPASVAMTLLAFAVLATTCGWRPPGFVPGGEALTDVPHRRPER